MAAETAQEREERLRQLSDNQKRRLAAETAQEREERLRQLSDNQQHTLAAETVQEREERLRQLSHNHQCRMEEAIYNSCVAPARHNAEHLSSSGLFLLIGERERANLVLQLGRGVVIYIYIYVVISYVVGARQEFTT